MHDPAAVPPSPDFRALFEALPGPCLVLDADLLIVAANDAYEQAAGLRREDMLGTSVFGIVPAAEAEELRASLRRVLEGGAADAMPIRPDTTGESSWRPVNSPLAGGDGKLAYIVHRLEDATELVRLQRSIDDAQRFAYLAAHDLQSPLNAIAGCVRLLREESEGRLSEQGEKYMGYVLDYTQRAQTLIRDLLAYTRLETRPQSFEPTSLAIAFHEARDLMAAHLDEKGAQVVCGDLPTLRADRSQMTLLLAHLLDNAVKFNRAEPPEVRLTAERRGDQWLFAMRDNGIGIEPRFHEEIFDICRKLHSAQAYPGSGVGLTACRRIVTRHGGRIWVESGEGEGSTFFFSLPADKDGKP